MSSLSFTRGSIWRLSYPIMVAGLSQSLLMLTDTAFLGRLGEVELGAGGMANLWYFLLVVTSLGLSNGVQVMVSRRLAQGKYKAIGRVVRHGLVLALVFCLATFALIYWAMPPLLTLYLDSKAVHAATVAYLDVRAFDLAFVFFTLLMRGFYTGIGENQIIIWSTLLTAFSNFGLCFFFVLGYGGFPAMGVAGAALSTVIAQGLGAGLMIGHMYMKGHVKKYRIFRAERMRKELFGRLMSLSGPTIVQYLMSMIGFLYLMYEIEKLGETQLAVSELVKTAYITLMIPTWGFQAASSTLVSYVIGAGHPGAVMKIVWRIGFMSLGMAVVVSVFMIVIPETTFSLYTEKEHLLKATPTPSRVVGTLLMAYALGGVYLHAVIGAGATRFAMYAEIFIISMYCAAIFAVARLLPGSLTALWASEYIYMGLMVTISYLYLRSKRWVGLEV